MSYTRVLPRDLFNEAKLLKCAGRLALLVHDNITPDGTEMVVSHEKFDTPGFNIEQDEDGSLYISNLFLVMRDRRFKLYCNYNSKETNYPLSVRIYGEWDSYEEFQVFDEEGNYDSEFIEFCKKVIEQSKENTDEN